MRNFFRPITVLTLGAAAFTAPAQAQQPTSKLNNEVSIGVLNGKAQEFVYNADGSTLSRLDWQMKNVAMFNTKTTYQALPWLAFGLKASTNMSGGARMDDYDFDVVGCPASGGGHTECHSTHPDTKLQRAHRSDLFATAQLYKISGVNLDAVAGYMYDYYKWQAFNGSANYAAIPPGLGISYEQKWQTPYLGLAAAMKMGDWSVSGRLIGSSMAHGTDRDHHHLRGLVFSEDLKRSSFVGGDLNGAYRLSSTMELTFGYNYQNWRTAKGPTTIAGFGGGVTIPDAGGANNVSHTVSLGLKVDLNPVQSTGNADSRSAAWTGWYGGVTSGYERQNAKWQTTSIAGFAPVADTASAGFNNAGQRFDGFAGYGFQNGRLIWGVEADLGKSNTTKTQAGIPGTGPADILPYMSDAVIVGSGFDGSLRVRAGAEVMSSTMIYGTAGLAFQQIHTRVSCPASGIASWCVADRDETANTTKVGVTVGAGYEKNFAEHWFTRGEYRYTHLGSFSHTYFANAPMDSVEAKIDLNNHRLTFGLGRRF
jgi:plasminogen activator